MKQNYITYVHLLTPLHTGGSADEGNLMGIAREIHTEFPYLPSSSVRGKIRSELENEEGAEMFFGQKIKDGQQPTVGEVWFADATLIFFPIASLNHHLVWITRPLWLERWNRWLNGAPLQPTIDKCRESLSQNNKSALVSFPTSQLYLQTALLKESDLEQLKIEEIPKELQSLINNNSAIVKIINKLVVLTDEDCIGLVETGLQREVRVALEEGTKTVKGGSFRSEEAIPPEAVLFFPWGMKAAKEPEETSYIRLQIIETLNDKLQFGGLEGIGRGWTDLTTTALFNKDTN